MSENTPFADAPPAPSESPSSPVQQAGAMLRQAREQAGLHVEALAVALKVPVQKVLALEAGRIDLLPDATFARGLAASICRGLKIDPKPVLDLMPGIAGERRAVSPPAINARFEPGAPSSGPALRGNPSPAMWVVLVLLLGALAIYLWPSRSDEAAEPQAVAPLAQPGTVTESVLPAEPPQAVAPVPAPVAPTPEPAVSAPAAEAPLLQFVAKAETWVQVTDAQGQTPLRRSLVAGETVTASGTPPLTVVVGRIDAVEVQVRGQVRDLRSLAKSNVARFEVR